MTKNDAIRKMEFCKNAYQKLIDEEVDNGTFVGTGVNGVWKADTPLTKAYSDMVDACDMAIKALEQEPSGGYINRKELDKALYDRFHDENSPNNITDVHLGTVRKFVQNFPSAVTPYEPQESEDKEC